MPTKTGEAIAFAESIQQTLNQNLDGYGVMVGTEEIGQLLQFEAIKGEPWSHLGVSNIDLARCASLLNKGILRTLDGNETRIPTPMCRIDELFKIGPSNDQIGREYDSKDMRGAYTLFPVDKASDLVGETRFLWEADKEKQVSMQTSPTHRGVVRDQIIQERIANGKGRLHYSQGMRWTSQSLLVAYTDQSVFGGTAWLTLIHSDARVNAAFALWGNSTFGMLAHWTQGKRTQGGRSRVTTKSTMQIKCPDFRRLPGCKLDVALEYFEILKSELLRPACKAHTDSVRLEIDESVIDIFGLTKVVSPLEISRLRKTWCLEPSVSGNRFSAPITT